MIPSGCYPPPLRDLAPPERIARLVCGCLVAPEWVVLVGCWWLYLLGAVPVEE